MSPAVRDVAACSSADPTPWFLTHSTKQSKQPPQTYWRQCFAQSATHGAALCHPPCPCTCHRHGCCAVAACTADAVCSTHLSAATARTLHGSRVAGSAPAHMPWLPEAGAASRPSPGLWVHIQRGQLVLGWLPCCSRAHWFELHKTQQLLLSWRNCCGGGCAGARADRNQHVLLHYSEEVHPGKAVQGNGRSTAMQPVIGRGCWVEPLPVAVHKPGRQFAPAQTTQGYPGLRGMDKATRSAVRAADAAALQCTAAAAAIRCIKRVNTCDSHLINKMHTGYTADIVALRTLRPVSKQCMCKWWYSVCATTTVPCSTLAALRGSSPRC